MSFDGGASIGSGTITSFKIGAISSTNTSAPTNVASGGIIMWTASSLPDGWLLADGSLVNKTDYATLFGILGNSFGTATSTQFYLPNLTDKFVIGKGSTYSTLGGTGGNSTITPSGTNSAPTFSGGSSTISSSGSLSGNTGSHTLTISEIPSHSHFVSNSGNGFPNMVQNNGALTMTRKSNGGAGNNDYILYGVSGQADQSPSQSIGGGGGHNHSLSGSISSTASYTPTGTVSAPTFSGASSNIINPYITLSYIIKT